jgi:hypothetical protein
LWSLRLWEQPGCVPFVSLVWIEPDPCTVRYWFVGRSAKTIAPYDREGKTITETSGAHRLWVKAVYRQVALTAQPAFGEEYVPGPDGQPVRNHFGLFPIASKPGQPTLCLVIDDFRQDPTQEAEFGISRYEALAKLKMEAYSRTTSPEFLLYCREDTVALYTYWAMKRRDRFAPSRAHIDPIEMKRWLAGLMLVDVARPPIRLTYRLVGTRCVRARGFDPTGRAVQEGFFGPNLAEVMEAYRLAVEDHKVVYRWDISPSVDETQKIAEMLILPLSSDGRIVDMVMVYYAHAMAD